MADQSNTYQIETRLDFARITQDFQDLRNQLARGIKKIRAGKGLTGVDRQVKDLGRTADRTAEKLKKVEDPLNRAGDGAGKFAKSTQATTNALNDVARRVFVWGSLSAAIFGSLQALKELYAFTIKVNTAMAELRKVLPRETDFEFLKGKAFDLSITFGTDPEDVLKLFKRFGQAGLDVQNTIKATRSALLGLNTTGAETEQIFNAIVGANRIFKVDYEETGRLMDKIMRIQADFAVDAKDLIASITAVGPAITALNGDIDDLFGAIAAMGEAARVSGKEAANSLKRVFSRIASEEGVRALEGLGIAVYKSGTEFRNLRDIMADLAIKWKTMTSVQKQALSITLAQVRQYPKFQAMLENIDRAQEALNKSQGAFGDAFRANQDVMDTYAKQLTIAENKIKKFAEETLSSGIGIVGVFTQFKIGLGDLVDDLGAIGGVGANLLIMFGGFFAALRVGKLLLFSKSVNEATTGMSLFAMRNKEALVSVGKLDKKVAATTARMATISVWTVGIAAGIYALVAAWGYWTKESQRRNRIIEESTKKLREFKEELDQISFANLSKTVGTETKFQKIVDVFDDLEEKAGGQKVKVTDLVDAYADLFYGVSADNLTAAQLDELHKRLDKIQTTIKETALAPFFEEVSSELDDLIPSLNKIQKTFGRLMAEETPWFEQKKEFAAIRRELTAIQQDWGFFWKETDKSKEQITGVYLSLRKAINAIVGYREELAALGPITKNTNEEIKKQAEILENKVQIQAYQGATAILGLIDTQKLFTTAAEDVNKVLGGAFIMDSAVASANAMAEVSRRVVELLKEEAKQFGLTNLQIMRLTDSFYEVAEAATKAEEKTKIFTLAFNSAAFLSGLKKTTASILGGFQAQLEAMVTISESGAEFGKVFNLTDESIKAIDTTLRQLTTTIGGNKKELSSLSIQAEAVENVLEKIRAGKGLTGEELALRDPKAIGKLEDTYKRIVLQRYTLNEFNKINEKQLKDQAAQLLRLKKELITINKQERSRELNLKKQADLIKAVVEKQIELSNIRTPNQLRALKENEELYGKILKAQLDYHSRLVEMGRMEEGIADTKKEELQIQYDINKAVRELEAYQSRISDLYSDVQSSADAVGDAFADLITNQERFFEGLQQKGSAMAVFGDTIRSIAQTIAKADADIVAEWISEEIKSSFRQGRTEIEQLEKDVDRITRGILTETGKLIQTPIEKGGNAAAQAIHDKMIDAAKYIEEIQSRLPDIVLGSFRSLLAEVGTTDSVADAINTQTDGVLKDIEVNTAIMAGKESKEVTKVKGIDSDAAILEQQLRASSIARIFADYGDIINEAAKEYALNPNLIAAVIEAESRGRPDVISEKGAKGLMQLIDKTAKEMEVKDVFDPRENIFGGSRYLKQMLDQFSDDRRLALAAYNAGPSNVVKYGGIPPFAETEQYTKRVTDTLDALTKKDVITIPEILTMLESNDLQPEQLAMTMDIVTAVSKVERAVRETGAEGGDLEAAAKAAQKAAMTRAAVGMMGNALIGALGNQLGTKPGDISTGSQLGMVGALFGGAGPWGILGASLGGGLLGAILGRKDDNIQEKQLAVQERIQDNTLQMVERLSPELINSPASFVLPAGTGVGGGGINVVNNITVNGDSGGVGSVVDELEIQLNNLYSRSSRGSGL